MGRERGMCQREGEREREGSERCVRGVSERAIEGGSVRVDIE